MKNGENLKGIFYEVETGQIPGTTAPSVPIYIRVPVTYSAAAVT
jgi:hypothetical protein